MDFVIMVLMLGGLLSAVAFLVLVVRPFPALPVKTRGQAAVGIVVSLAMVMVGGMLIPKSETSKTAPPANEHAEASEKAVDVAAVRTADAKAFIDSIVATVAVCDGYDEKISDATQKRDVLEIYQVAKAGEAACDDATRAIDHLTAPPSLSKKAVEEVRGHLAELSKVYAVKAYKFSLFAKVANGDQRPSTLTELQETSENVERQTIMTFGRIYFALSADGVDTQALGPKALPKSDQAGPVAGK